MLNAAAQKQIVSAARRDPHPHSLPVDVFDGANRRSRRYEIGTFDLNVRSGEVNLVCPARIDRQECHVPSTVLRGIEHFSSRVESDKLHRQVESLTELQRQINCHAAEIAAGRISGRQYRISIVDSNTQFTRRRKIRKHRRRNGFRHSLPAWEWKLLLIRSHRYLGNFSSSKNQGTSRSKRGQWVSPLSATTQSTPGAVIPTIRA